MKKTIIALALAGIGASASAFYDAHGNWLGDGGGGYTFDTLGGVTVIGNAIPPGANICAPFACEGPWTTGGGGATASGTGSGGPGGVPPTKPPAPPPPPPQTKEQNYEQFARQRDVRNNACAIESRSLEATRENRALAVERMRLGTVLLKLLLADGWVPDIPGAVQAEIDREVKSFDKFCNAIAAEAQNVCYSNCAKMSWFLPMLLLARRRKEEDKA